MNPKVKILNKAHQRKHFSCGNNSLDIYFQKAVSQDIKRNLARCYVLTDIDDNSKVLGFYTLATSGIPKHIIPIEFQSMFKGPYKAIPTIILGRLAVDKSCQGMQYGKHLLVDALKKSYEASKDIAAVAVIVDPIDDQAKDFYSKYGFKRLPDSGRMFLTMKAISVLFS